MKLSRIPGPLALAAFAASMAAGCGQALVPGTTYDGPLITIGGTIGPPGGLEDARDRNGAAPVRNPLVTLLWTDPLQRQPDVPAPPWTLGSTVDRENNTFTIEVFRPPPASALVDVAAPSGEVSTLALAEIVMIDDADGDGTFRVDGPRAAIVAPDLYLAGSVSVLVYVARPYPTPQVESPVAPDGIIGFQTLRYRCVGQVAARIEQTPPSTIDLIVQTSIDFPELRDCRRTHSP